ncbi:MAG: response regulator transcription factor [Bacteroidetes bacterium]|nr:response regulator transcription factor [Bacteroidota bacterium]
MYNCLIVDDEPVAREIIENYCNHLPLLKVIKSCDNALDAKAELQKQEIDIIFLDINMPVLNGIAFLKTLTKPPLIIFTTAYKEYALNAFDLAACDYLLKPFSLERFIIAVDKAIERISKKQPDPENPSDKVEDFFFIKTNGKIIRIKHDEFLFAEAQGNYVKIVSSNSTTIANMTFAGFEELLPANTFTRVHRSFIINKSKISYIEGNTVFIEKTEIPIGSNYKNSLLKDLRL